MCTTLIVRAGVGISLAVLFASCGSSNSSSVGGEPQTTHTTQTVATTKTANGPVIPDGTWSKTATVQQADALGITPAMRTKYLGHGGQMPLKVIWKIQGSTWSVFTSSGGRPPELGDGGSSRYPTAHRWTTDNGQNAYTYAWTIHGGALRLRVVHKGAANTDTSQDYKIVRLITEGTFRRK